MDIIDEIDLNILRLLSTDSRMHIKDLSKSVHLSEPSIKRRIEKMMDKGIIKSFTIEIDYSKLGYSLPFYIQISDLTIHFKEFTKKILHINPTLSISAITGKDNYIIQGRVQKISDVEKLLSALMEYGKISTSLILEKITNKKIIDIL